MRIFVTDRLSYPVFERQDFMRKKKVLFFSESVTLAHVARPLSLAAALDPQKYDIHIALGSIPSFLTSQLRQFTTWNLSTAVSSKEFIAALAKGDLPYKKGRLQKQINEDLELMERIKPDLVVGDFRLSLGISARLKNIPYINVTNSTWSPLAKQMLLVPDLPIVDMLGEKITKSIFRFIKPIIFNHLAEPFNQVARRYGLKPFGGLLDVYTSGDWVFFADMPGLVPMAPLPENQIVAGHVEFSAPVSSPSWLENLSPEVPLIYVSLGSSGNQTLLPQLVEALSQMPITAVISTAGARVDLPRYPNIFITDYVHAETVLKKAHAMIGNGGSLGSYTALAMGVPLLSIPSNLDQYQFSTAVKNWGAGLVMRKNEVKPSSVKSALEQLLADRKFKESAHKMKDVLNRCRADLCFSILVERLTEQMTVNREILEKLLESGQPSRGASLPIPLLKAPVKETNS